jgi:hypothetical protein
MMVGEDGGGDDVEMITEKRAIKRKSGELQLRKCLSKFAIMPLKISFA